jgi:hypothetical protein
MKRSAPMKRGAPLARTGFKRKEPGVFKKQLDRNTQIARRAAMKSKPKRPTVAEGSKYLAACRDEPCYLNVLCPWTDWADPTVVDCHSNQSKHGKAGARKADHEFTVPGCARCHDWYDNSGAPYELKCAKFDNALERWAPRRARKMGLEMQEAA